MQSHHHLERDSDGLTQLHRAAKVGDVDACLNELLAGVDPDVPSGVLVKDGEDRRDWSYEPAETPLLLAIENHHPTVVELLLERNADVSRFDSTRWTPLHATVAASDHAMMERLLTVGINTEVLCLRRGCDEELGWFFVNSPLHLAALRSDVVAATLLLDARASISSCWIDGRTPLIYAAARGSTDVVELLCARGADPNQREHRHEYAYFLDMAPLHYAARNRHRDTFEALIRLGAEPRAVESHSGQTAADMRIEFQGES